MPRLCVGGLAVDKRLIKITCLFLIAIISIQFVQVEIQKEKERENWRQFRLYMDAQKSEANPLLTGVLASAAAPHVLAALVLGTGAYWCWSHGGKEAWLQMNQALCDGVVVTKEWIQNRIAELHGINTGPSGGNYRDGNVIQYGGRRYRVWLTSSGIGPATPQQPFVYANNPARIYEVGAYSDTYNGVPRYVNTMWSVSEDLGPAPSGFVPAEHPQLFEGPALLTNCHAVASANRGLWTIPAPTPTATAPAGASAAPPAAIVPPVHLVAVDADGSAIDNRGSKWPPLPGVIPDLLNPPSLAPGSTVDVPLAPAAPGVAPETVTVPAHIGQPLLDLLPAGATIKHVIPGQGVVYVPAGAAASHPGIYQPLTPAVANALPVTLPTAAAGADVLPGNPAAESESDPGNPADIALPDIPAFDAEVDWGEEKPWPWAEWLGSLPFLDFLRGSSIQLQGAQSVLSFDYNLLGKSGVMRVNFGEYESVLNAMGIIIYACSCFYALQLALLKRD